MRIAAIEVFFLRYDYPEDLKYRFIGGRVEALDVAVVRVTAESGEYGIGELTFGQFTYEPIVGLVTHFGRLLAGHPVERITHAWEIMYLSSAFWNRAGLGIAVMGAINMAMYDLVGKIRGVPVHALLGGFVRPRARVYASNGLFTDAEELVADVRRAEAAGFDGYKLRVVSTKTIVDQLTAFRDTVGDGMDVMVDAVQGAVSVPWSMGVARRLPRDIEPFAPAWLEEPVRIENLDGWASVRDQSRVNIAGAESIPTAFAFRPYLERGAFDILQFDIATAAFTEGTRIGHLAAVHGLPVALHSWGTAISIAAGIHMALVMPNCTITEYNFTRHPLNDLLFAEPLRIEDGHVAAPTTPGLGLRFDPEWVKEYPYEAAASTLTLVEDRDIQLS
ncbi:MAG TPA: mandelate racemase/muconate lactonizing enzyme family protein [Bauldia sp.]|nr:mandelate racemase/muconate lactonizing enzyme family protein [Bauldia sp.]